MATKRINTYSVIQPGANTSALGVDSSDNTVLIDLTNFVPTPPGTVQAYAGSTAPSGWLLCDGSAVSRATYANLFAAISTIWGAGDGSTTFNLPDGRGAVLRGTGTGSVNGRDKVGPAVGAKQEDQMQRITGFAARVWSSASSGGNASGALSWSDVGAENLRGGGSTLETRRLDFNSATSPDARASATTDGETRAYGIGVQWIIKT